MANRVLIVEDERDLSRVVAYNFQKEGFDVVVAFTGEQALRAVKEERFDLVLLDLMLPDISGTEVCKKLKQNPQTAQIPVVMVTALNEVGDVERAVDSGADDFLTKPVNRLELVTRVRSLLRVRVLKKKLDRTLAEMKRMKEQA